MNFAELYRALAEMQRSEPLFVWVCLALIAIITVGMVGVAIDTVRR